ncbi:shikimate dehydrogenase [Paenibacillus sp. J22TS3]|uniref:shikimate dehydrogenase n=1 Tax=Paenibacillus sp. J22TS3 TaxID=2807192 RepID=UPI001B1B0432|nr:shikimate dehydrogenase [Paenibacillus sp. J22TS3]GIP20584.1 shikimate dehydrogenase (NADP(+)) [Paenibacillus sp. J22TS3]
MVTEKKLRSAPLLLGVMGDPIAHSKSPVMHEAALRALSLQGSYVPLHVKRERLAQAVEGIRAMGFRGVNVTVPHKVEVMSLLDDIDDGARRIGAVNTIVNQDGHLTGYNTDGIGYVRSLKEEVVFDLKGKTVIVLGAGGAARGIIYALLQEAPGQIVIANRTADKAVNLAREWSGLGNLSGCAVADVRQAVSRADVLINTTSVGMHPDIHSTPLESSWIPEGIVVSDLIYNPLETVFLRQAKERGCQIHGGLGMFINQGAYAFEYWTGMSAPAEVMREAVLHSLQN